AAAVRLRVVPEDLERVRLLSHVLASREARRLLEKAPLSGFRDEVVLDRAADVRGRVARKARTVRALEARGGNGRPHARGTDEILAHVVRRPGREFRDLALDEPQDARDERLPLLGERCRWRRLLLHRLPPRPGLERSPEVAGGA